MIGGGNLRAGGPSRGVPDRSGREGASTIGSLLVVVFGGGTALVIITLFVTGLAQKEILPRIKDRAQKAVAQVTEKTKSKEAPPAEAAPADSLRSAGVDSLESLRTQVETQRRFLEEEQKDLTRIRGSVDSLVSAHEVSQNKEMNRTAKLLAGMKPEEAAQILDQMEDATVQALLARLSPRAASKVLPKLDAARVARLTMAAIGTAELSAAVSATQSPRVPRDAAQ